MTKEELITFLDWMDDKTMKEPFSLETDNDDIAMMYIEEKEQKHTCIVNEPQAWPTGLYVSVICITPMPESWMNASCKRSCSPSDWCKGGKCDLNGCYFERP